MASDVYEPEKVEQIYGMGRVLKHCDHIPIPEFKAAIPRFLAVQRMRYFHEIRDLFLGEETDIVFSTQSSLFMVPSLNLYHFVYNLEDLFGYPYGSLYPLLRLGLHYKIYYYLLRHLRKIMIGPPPEVTKFLCLSYQVYHDLKRMGYENAEIVFPPCRTEFKPKAKNGTIVQVTRIVPQKRLEWFIEAARRLPSYKFIILGRDDPILKNLNPGYSRRLLRKLPANLTYIPGTLKDQPWVMEEAKVYLYTGLEPGIGIALCEAIGAGCIPISPSYGGGGEVVRAAKVGYTYNTKEEMIGHIRKSMEADPWPVEEISRRAEIFSPEVFEKRITGLIGSS